MILELVLIYVQRISAFYLWLSASVQTISWFYHWFLSNSNLCQYSATVFQATAQPISDISAFPLVCHHCSAYFSTLPWVFIYFFHSQDWFSSVFFSSVLCLINFHHCVIVFSFFLYSAMFIFVHHLLSLWHCVYMVLIVILFHQFWSFVIVFFLGFVMLHIYIYIHIYIYMYL